MSTFLTTENQANAGVSYERGVALCATAVRNLKEEEIMMRRNDDEKTTRYLLTIIFSVVYLFSSLGLIGLAFGASLRGFLLT